MEFFFRNLEQAQAQAKLAALNAQKSAKGFAQQVSEQGKVFAEHVSENTRILAEQASCLSKEAAETASQKLRSLEQLQPKLATLGKQPEAGQPSAAELQEFGITDEFLDFVRSLTYSTFRDFPADAPLPSVKVEEDDNGNSNSEAKYLTPWQEHHAMLVVQQAKEINELRYVLCPKRMTDAQFWHIYFQLAKKYLPAEAFDSSYVPACSTTPGMSITDLQDRKCVSSERMSAQTKLTQLSTTAKQWSVNTGASLRNVAASHFGQHGEPASSTLHEIAVGRGVSSAAAASSQSRDADPAHAEPAAGLGADQELEAYLRDVMHSDGKDLAAACDTEQAREGNKGGHADAPLDRFVAASDGHDIADDDDDDDFEKYLNELSASSDEGEFVDGHSGGDGHEPGTSKAEADSGDDLDLDDYMRVLADEDKR